jgi:hypothetical protein
MAVPQSGWTSHFGLTQLVNVLTFLVQPSSRLTLLGKSEMPERVGS